MARSPRSALDTRPRRIDDAPDFRARERCYRCMRPAAVCWCALLPRIESPTRVLFLQHPREEFVAIGTARMASLCLPGSELVVGTEVQAHPSVARALDDPERRAILLWPGPGALDLAEHPPKGPTTLVVVDGTWSLAKKLVRLNPAIAALPRYALRPDRPSEYRIRAEPSEHCVSTIEAVIQALGSIDGDRARYEPMMDPFRAMIDRQIERQESGDNAHVRLRKRAPSPRPVPRWMREARSVVVVVGEASAFAFDAPARPNDELVHWVAVRLRIQVVEGEARVTEAERFEQLCAPATLAPTCPRHTRLDEDQIRTAGPFAELAERWRAFLEPSDVVTSWSSYAPELFVRQGGGLPGEVFDLRAAMTAHLRERTGSVADCVTHLGLAHQPIGLGRGGERLGMSAALARLLLEQAVASGAVASGAAASTDRARPEPSASD
jgi:DTW domain-containing protein YfiP